MIVYIVTEGTYSGYHIEAVFENAYDAKKYVHYHEEDGDCYSIERWDTDDKQVFLRNAPDIPVCECWTVKFLLDGEIVCCEPYLEDGEYSQVKKYVKQLSFGRITVSGIQAKDAEHAKKIACDMRAEYLAKLNGIA